MTCMEAATWLIAGFTGVLAVVGILGLGKIWKGIKTRPSREIMSETRTTRRFCKCIGEDVELKAKVAVVKAGSPAQTIKTQLVEWSCCSKQETCGKKCNYFYAPNLADCEAGSEKDTTTFP